MAYIFDLADTWSNGTTIFHGIKLTVTDTASHASSRLIDLLIGSASKFSVDNRGTIRFGNSGAFTSQLYPNGNTAFNIICYGQTVGGFGAVDNPKGLSLSSDAGVLWNSGPGVGLSATTDLRLYRDAAAQLAQRNGTNPQTFYIYNTYTDASNYERFYMRFIGNVFDIGTQAAGTGIARSLRLQTTTYLPAGSGSGNISAYGNGTNIASDNGLRLNGYNGNLELTINNGSATSRIWMTASRIDITHIPTSDPVVAGRLWNDSGTLKISAG